MTHARALFAALLALLFALPALSAARAEGYGYGYRHGPGAFHHHHRTHRPGPDWWHDFHRAPNHHGYRHHRHHRGSGAFLTWRAPAAPRYAERMPPRVHSTRCERGAWREADGRIVRGVACRGADGRWRMAD